MCRTEKGCPKGTPENQRSLWPENEDCYEHYQECVAVNQFPDDPLVRQNARIIRDVLDTIKRQRDLDFQAVLIEIVSYR